MYDKTRRIFAWKVACATLAVVTFAAMPSFASAGSTRGNNVVQNWLDPQYPAYPPVNVGPGTGPGYPGKQGLENL